MRSREQRRWEMALRTGKSVEEIEAAEKLIEEQASKVDLDSIQEVFGNRAEFRGCMEAMDVMHDPFNSILEVLSKNASRYTESQASLALMMTTVLVMRLFKQEPDSIIRMAGQACVLADTFQEAMHGLKDNPFDPRNADD